jgi:hypothetical protein
MKKRKKKKKPSPKSTTHTTVTLPIDLKQNMDEFRAKYKVNWSRVACSAWRQYLKKYGRHTDYEGVIE